MTPFPIDLVQMARSVKNGQKYAVVEVKMQQWGSDAAIRPGASPVRAPDRDLHLSPMSRSTNGRPEPEVIVQVRIPS